MRGIQDYLEVPLRRPLLVLAPLVLVLGAAVTASQVLPKKYRTSTLILVESDLVPDTFVRKIATETVARRLQTIRQEVLSRTRLERVITELQPYPESSGAGAPTSALVEHMRRSISIATKGSDAFVIEFVHTDPAMAMAVANRLTTLFIEEAEAARATQAMEGFEFINSQVTEARRALEEKESAVRLFKERHLGTLPEQMTTNLAILQRLQQEQQTVSENVRAAQARVDLLRHPPPPERGGGAGPVGGATELAQLRVQLASARTRYTDEHPDVRILLRRIRELEARQAQRAPEVDDPSFRPELPQAELELVALHAKQAGLDEQIARMQNRVEAAPSTEQVLSTLTRDYTQLQTNYLDLLKKQADAQMAEQLEQRWKNERFKVLDPAHLPDRHFFPSLRLFAMGGLLAGLVLGLVLAFAVELLDHSVKNVVQLEEAFPLPLLASIPHIKPRRVRARDLRGAA